MAKDFSVLPDTPKTRPNIRLSHMPYPPPPRCMRLQLFKLFVVDFKRFYPNFGVFNKAIIPFALMKRIDVANSALSALLANQIY